jgi:hypothetical protein
MAIVYGVPIIGFNWIKECREKNEILPYDKYRFKKISTGLLSLFDKFMFYFPNVGQFSNFRINKSKFSHE